MLFRAGIFALFGAYGVRVCSEFIQAQRARMHLELPFSFDERDLRVAYRRQSLRAHPDKGGSQAEFIRTSWAYKQLSGASDAERAGQLAVAIVVCWLCWTCGGVNKLALARMRRSRKRRNRWAPRTKEAAASSTHACPHPRPSAAAHAPLSPASRVSQADSAEGAEGDGGRCRRGVRGRWERRWDARCGARCGARRAERAPRSRRPRGFRSRVRSLHAWWLDVNE